MVDDEDLPIVAPRFGGGPYRGPSGEGASFRNALLARIRSSAFRARRASARGVRPGGPKGSRRVVVKAHVHRMGPSGAKAAALHLRYIERDGVERDGSKGVLYTADGPARAEAFEQPRPGEAHQFRLIVSPEDGAELDLTAYVRRLMATVERDLGRRIEWAAVNHHDTGHPHAHIVLRGVDRDGQELRLDRAYISAGLRWRAQELATDELGPRLEHEVLRAREREVGQERFTSLDRQLAQRARDGRIDVRAGVSGSADASLLLARLEHLEGLRLAERESRTVWRLSEGWQERLRRLGARGDILQQIHAAVGGDPARYHVVAPGEPVPTDSAGGSPVVSGRVASKGLSDELKGLYYAVVETPAGRAYHVALDRRGAETVRTGDIVSLTSKVESPVGPADRRIAETARANGGLYKLDPAGGSFDARRVREMERLGLATPEAPDRWRVAPDVLDQLAARQGEAPARHRVVMHIEPLTLAAQVRHAGPVWLDRIKAESLAPYGFGAELRLAVKQRREALQRMGLQPDDPARSIKLREMERRTVGKDRAAATGQRFLPLAPGVFRGRLELVGAASAAASYAVVSDGERFVVLRTTSALRASNGKEVTVRRDGKGRLVVQPTVDMDIGR
jgi:type IV secretory pathway VirD2 relaxase